jgi:hypothetical protein
MSAMANIVAFDGDPTTPVQHTLLPISVEKVGGKAIALWREDLPNVPTDAQVYATMTMEKLKSGTTSLEFGVSFPVQEVVTGANSAGYSAAPKVAFEDKWIVRMYSNPRSTSAGRARVRGFGKNVLANTTTTTTPVVVGLTADLFDRIVFPT